MNAPAPNPFTDYATSGTEKNETIYVRNVCPPLRPQQQHMLFFF